MIPHTQLGMKQYNKEVPPGFRPGAYPVTEYEELLKVWAVLTTWTEPEKIGAAIYSRLEGGALDIARRLKITRMDPNTFELVTYAGLEAISLPASDAVLSQDGTVLFGRQPAGSKALVTRLVLEYKIDHQDRAWWSSSSVVAKERVLVSMISSSSRSLNTQTVMEDCRLVKPACATFIGREPMWTLRFSPT